MITRGRIVKLAFPDEPTSGATTQRMLATGRGQGRRIDGTLVDAYAEAGRIVAEAKIRADQAMTEAKAEVARAAETAAKDASDAAVAKLAAGFLALRAAEEKRAETDLAHTIELAKMLAERLLGAELEKSPARIAELAKSALAEARGARRAKILACAKDAAILAERLASLGMPEGTVTVAVDDTLTPGSLLLDTDLGVLDARLAPQLDRLTETLRDVLRGT